MKLLSFLAPVLSLALAATLAVAPLDADAKRLGGGKSSGLQRDMPARTAPDAPPPRPATPGQQAQGQSAAPGAAAAPATPPKRNWMGPLAGLAAGLGLAALFSHLGMGEAFGSFMMLALLGLVAVFAIRWFLRRNQPAPQAAGMAYSPAPAGGAQVAWPTGSTASTASTASTGAAETPAAAAPVTRAFVPAVFDSDGCARIAKTLFIRLQAANDAGDLNDLRAFTTPEMFAELSMDLRERQGAAQHTEVLSIDAQVLDVAEEPGRQVVSVRYHGQIREEAGAAPVAVDEVWHLVKPADAAQWAIAGIEQWRGPAH